VNFHRQHELLRRIAPELAPLRITRPPAELADLAKHARAFTSHVVDGALGGSGPTIYVCDSAANEEDLAGLCVHEAAHRLPFAERSAPPTDADVDHQSQLLARWAVEPNEHSITGLPPWAPFHGAPFVRNCIHLRHRAEAVGVELPWPAIADLANYSLSGFWRYARALSDEPARMLGRTFGEIHQEDPPSAFRQLFEADCEAWQRTRKLECQP
jgi:hypothetical protein